MITSILTALQILSAAGAAATAGYKLLDEYEKRHPGSHLTAMHEHELQASDPIAHQILISNGAQFAKDFG